MSARDYIIGDRRGYVMERAGKPSRIVIEVAGVDMSMSIDEAKHLMTLASLLLREAGAMPAVWMHALAHNLAVVGALAYAGERVGTWCHCRVCGEPTPRESWRRTVDGCPACWRTR